MKKESEDLKEIERNIDRLLGKTTIRSIPILRSENQLRTNECSETLYEIPLDQNEEKKQNILQVEQKNNEQRPDGITELTEKYRLIALNTSDLIAFTTFDINPTFTFVTPSHSKSLGYKEDELLGKPGLDFIHESDVEQLNFQLAYVVGFPSAGSTAPLWTLLLSAAYHFNSDPFLWTTALGAALLAISAWLLSRLADRLLPGRPLVSWLVGLACVGEWHLIWAAASGMETLLFIALALALIDRVWARSRSWIIGVLGGLLILTRPEGLLLFALALGAILILPRAGLASSPGGVPANPAKEDKAFAGGLREVVKAALAFLIVLAPGAYFNLQAGLRGIDPRLPVSLMYQYFPPHRAVGHPIHGRRLWREEALAASRALARLGVTEGWVQGHD